jgi:hypothetical protein
MILFALSLLALIVTSGCGGGTETVYVPIEFGSGVSCDGGYSDGGGGDPTLYFDAFDL